MESRSFTLFFKHIPRHFGVPKLKEIFSEYGEIVKFFIHHSEFYGMVEYDNISSCNKAIESLHIMPPMYMFVSMAKPGHNKIRKKPENGSNMKSSASSSSGKNDSVSNVPQYSRSTDRNSVDNTRMMSSKADGNYKMVDDDTVIYLDRFNKPIIVFEDQDGMVYVPLARVTGIKRAVKKGSKGTDDFLSNPSSYVIIDDNCDTNQRTGRNSSGSTRDDRKPNETPNQKMDRSFDNQGQTRSKSQHRSPKQFENRQPQPNNPSFKQHHNNCGGGGGGSSFQDQPNSAYGRQKPSDHENNRSRKSFNNQPGKFEGHRGNFDFNKITKTAEAVEDWDAGTGPNKLFTKRFQVRGPEAHANDAAGGPSKTAHNGDGKQEARIVTYKSVDIPSGEFTETRDSVVVQVENGDRGGGDIRSPKGDGGTGPRRAALSRVPLTQPITVDNSRCNVWRVQVGNSGYMEPTIMLKGNKFVSIFLPAELSDLLDTLHDFSKSCRAEPGFKPDIGSMVAAEHSAEGWCRAILLEQNSAAHIVAFVDFGRVCSVTELRPVSASLKAIPRFSCVCSVPEQHFKALSQCKMGVSFVVLAITPDFLQVQLATDADICIGEVVGWNPLESGEPVCQPECAGDCGPLLKLSVGDKVQLACENDGYLFVRTKQGHELIKEITSKLGEYAPTAGVLQDRPKVAQFVAAHFEGGWYRAVVNSVSGDQANICYIDYGNDETQPWNQLRLLSKELKQLPFTLFKIRLKNYAERAFSVKCLEYLADLAEKKTILTVSYEGSVESGVELTLKDGASVLSELNRLDGPAPAAPAARRGSTLLRVLKNAGTKSSPAERKQYKVPGDGDPKVWVGDLPMQPIPLGRNRIKILHQLNLSYGIFAFCLDNALSIRRVHADLSADIANYIKTVAPKQPYGPVATEVVLARHKDEWRRALCVDEEGDEFNLFYMDYGSSDRLSRDDIRRIPTDFISTEVIAYLGLIKDIPNEPSVECIRRLEQLLPENSTQEGNIIEKADEDCYRIDFPSVLRVLVREKLL